MLRGWRKKRFLVAVLATCSVVLLTVTFALPMRAQQDPPLKRLMRGRHRLLRKVYVNSPDTEVAGLAATIKADEITCKHRIRACRYLSTVDSVEYPEAKRMLVKTMHTDKWEVVRFEAAKALRVMMSGGADSRAHTPRLFRQWFRMWRRHTRRAWRRRVTGRRDYWADVCDSETLGALVRTAYEQDANGVCFEPSLRVRQAAVRAIIVSGVECKVGPYRANPSNVGARPILQQDGQLQWSRSAGELPDDFEPMAPFETGSDTFIELGNYEANQREAAPVQLMAGQIDMEWQAVEEPEVPSTTTRMVFDDTVEIEFDPSDFEPLSGEVSPKPEPTEPQHILVDSPLTKTAPALNGLCVVELRRSKKKVPASSEHRTAYAGRLYEFSSAEAKTEFYRSPDKYALAYSGYDPVYFATSGRMSEGMVLCEHAGRLYAFVSPENRQEFLLNPKPYSMQSPVESTEPTFDLTLDPEPPTAAPKKDVVELDNEDKTLNEFEADSLTLIAPAPKGAATEKATEVEKAKAAAQADLADIEFGDTDEAVAAASRMLGASTEPATADETTEHEIAPPPPPWNEEPVPSLADGTDADQSWSDDLDNANTFAPDAFDDPMDSDDTTAVPNVGAIREATDNPLDVFGESPAESGASSVADFPWDGDWKEANDSGQFQDQEESTFFESTDSPDRETPNSDWAPEPDQSQQFEPLTPRAVDSEWQSSDPRVSLRRRSSYFDSALRIPERGLRVTPITASAKRTPSITRRKIAGWTKPVQPVRNSGNRSLVNRSTEVASVKPIARNQQTTSVNAGRSPGRSSNLIRPRSPQSIRPVSTRERKSGSVQVFSITGRSKSSGVRHAVPDRQ